MNASHDDGEPPVTDEKQIIVRLDPDIQDLIPGYIENRRQDIRIIHTALQEDDYEKIRLAGHSMKGSGAGYGFHEIARIGKNIESAASEADRQGVVCAMNCLGHYLDSMKIVYENDE